MNTLGLLKTTHHILIFQRYQSLLPPTPAEYRSVDPSFLSTLTLTALVRSPLEYANFRIPHSRFLLAFCRTLLAPLQLTKKALF
jgi:hypothetical protein